MTRQPGPGEEEYAVNQAREKILEDAQLPRYNVVAVASRRR